TIQNRGQKKAYLDLEVVDVSINDEKITFGSAAQAVPPGKSAIFMVKAPLEEADFEHNKLITVRARYGEREGILLKTLVREFELKFTESRYKPLLLVAIVIILVLMLKYRKKRRQ
ncbi:MAG: hypothetical protein AABX31_02180, partial [Nanoarchaeota archaeon]